MIVVTGGAGFIGSALIAGLNKRQITDILVVDELACDEKWKNLQNLSFADYVEKDDFLEMVMAGKTPSGIEAVLHMGACTSTTERPMPIFVLSTPPVQLLTGTVRPALVTTRKKSIVSGR